MARKSKVRVDRIIILILVAILILGVLGFGAYFLFDSLKDKKENKPNNYVPPVNVETTDGVNVKLNNYDVYIDDTNKLGFNFIVAELEFSSDKAVNFDLKNLQTSEKITLDTVADKLQKLEENGYKISKLNISTYISSKENNVKANIFIPFNTDQYSLQVYNLNNPKTNIVIDLTENNKILTSLKFETEQTIDVNNTNVTVSSCSISTMMTHNGEEYYISSTSKVFTFKIFVNEVENNVYIEDAYFIKDGEDEQIQCMSSEYNSAKVENILGKKLVTGENGALFFETYSKDEKPNYAGILMLKFSNSNDWVKVSTELE